ncbi:type III secretion system chaperone [Mailhella massiliensis]|uniref:Type III secretion system chaperone n=1 Tax=Mailhella massiliensis TaxID=1903261 RepID=A0A921DR23_9BACT|nr:type III secretion system chaperone [Mailhella massiliensis]HJD96513.1 type III secretion system chaperone [Mailhella massiliensis]
MEWTTTMERFGASIGIDHLAPDTGNCCSLLFDSQDEITFTHDEEDRSLLLYSEIGSASGLSREACLTLLKASLLGAETGGAALSIHDRLDQVVLWKRYDDNTLTADTMKDAVNSFLAQISFWKKRLAELATEYETENTPGENSAITMDNFGMFV